MSTPPVALRDTGERLIPDHVCERDPVAAKLLPHHLARYEWLRPLVPGKRVLDIACGAGFGSSMLAQFGAAEVVAADCDMQAVEYARARYEAPNISFLIADAQRFDFGRFDLIVSFETLEHLEDTAAFLRCARASLNPAGMLAISATIVPTCDLYAFHRHDFDGESLRALLESHGFSPVDQLDLATLCTPQELRRSIGTRGSDGLRILLGRFAKQPLAVSRRLWLVLVRDGLQIVNRTYIARLSA